MANACCTIGTCDRFANLSLSGSWTGSSAADIHLGSDMAFLLYLGRLVCISPRCNRHRHRSQDCLPAGISALHLDIGSISATAGALLISRRGYVARYIHIRDRPGATDRSFDFDTDLLDQEAKDYRLSQRRPTSSFGQKRK